MPPCFSFLSLIFYRRYILLYPIKFTQNILHYHFLIDDINDPYVKIKYSFSSYLTYIVRNDLNEIATGQTNLTGTIASEGLIALGFPFMYLFSIIGALIVGINYQIIKNALIYNKPKITAISSTFFVFCTWSWLKGGDITSILHISNIIGIIFTYMMLSFLEKLSLFYRGMMK